MTITQHRAAEAVKDPRDLVEPEVFELLVEDIMRYHAVTREYAARVMGQALVFLKAIGDNQKAAAGDPNQWERYVPAIPVDPGWHAFILRTEPYAEFCERVAGSYLHHVPVMIPDIQSGQAMARTIPALHRTGYRVDMEFWADQGESCCPPNPCVAR